MAENKTLQEWINEFEDYATDGGGVILDSNDSAEILKLLIELEHSRKTGVNVISYNKIKELHL